jgi:hypothetical protein
MAHTSFALEDLPDGLKPVAKKFGLMPLIHCPPGIAPYPLAGNYEPLWKDPVAMLQRMPVNLNFHAEVFDLDDDRQREAYELLMTYLRSGYGAWVVNLERIWLTKTKVSEDGTSYEDQVRRISIEYYAPYRVLPPKQDEVP